MYTLFIDFVSVKTSFKKKNQKREGYSLLICIAGILNLSLVTNSYDYWN